MKWSIADALSRQSIVIKPEGGKNFDFDPAAWNPDEGDGADELGVRVALLECVQLVVDQVEATKPFIEAHNVETLEKVFLKGQRPIHLDETPVKMIDTHEVAAVMEVFRLDNMSDSEMRAEQISDSLCLDMIRYLEDGLEPGEANRSLPVTRTEKDMLPTKR